MSGIVASLLGILLFAVFAVGTVLFVLPGFLGLVSGHPWSVGGAVAWWLGWIGVLTGVQNTLAGSTFLSVLPFLVAGGILAACFVSIYRTVHSPTTERHPVVPERLRQ